MWVLGWSGVKTVLRNGELYMDALNNGRGLRSELRVPTVGPAMPVRRVSTIPVSRLFSGTRKYSKI